MRKPVSQMMVRMLILPPLSWCKHRSGKPGTLSSMDAGGSTWKLFG